MEIMSARNIKAERSDGVIIHCHLWSSALCDMRSVLMYKSAREEAHGVTLGDITLL